MTLLQRSVLVEGWCPYCQAMVQIEDGGPEDDQHVIGPEQVVETARMIGLHTNRMIHHVSRWPHEGWERHEWLTEQSVRLTQVKSLHLTVI